MEIDDTEQAEIFELCRRYEEGAILTDDEKQRLRDWGFRVL